MEHKVNVKEFIERFTCRLSRLGWYSSREIRTMALYLLKEVALIESYKIIVSPELELDSATTSELLGITEQMALGYPMQYALGYEYFCSHKFRVQEGVLIPRPETEELVRLVVGDFAGTRSIPKKILDICTGSGCIAWSLAAALPQSRVWGCDISNKALEIACSQEIEEVELLASGEEEQKNGCSFFKCDIFESNALNDISNICKTEDCGIDVIVSNPPYVCEQEKMQMRPNVLDFEPEEALFVPDTGPLLFYERIAGLSGQLLKRGGRLYFEVNERFAHNVANEMEKCGFAGCEVVQDMFGKDRMVKCIKK